MRISDWSSDVCSSDLKRCLYVYHGPVILYTLTQACIPTRFAFPNHLSIRTEETGLGIDTAVEVRRILASWPAVIVDGESGFHTPTPRKQGLVHDALERLYRHIGTFRGRGGVSTAEVMEKCE